MVEIYVKEHEVILLILCHLKQLRLFDALVALERETEVVADDRLPSELLFLRKLVLDGSWKDVSSTLELLKDQEFFNVEDAEFFILRQQFLEMISIPQTCKPRELSSLLVRLSKLRRCTEDELNQLKLAVARMDARIRFPAWTVSSGRYETFLALLKYTGLLKLFPLVGDNLSMKESSNMQSAQDLSSVSAHQLTNIIRVALEQYANTTLRTNQPAVPPNICSRKLFERISPIDAEDKRAVHLNVEPLNSSKPNLNKTQLMDNDYALEFDHQRPKTVGHSSDNTSTTFLRRSRKYSFDSARPLFEKGNKNSSFVEFAKRNIKELQKPVAFDVMNKTPPPSETESLPEETLDIAKQSFNSSKESKRPRKRSRKYIPTTDEALGGGENDAGRSNVREERHSSESPSVKEVDEMRNQLVQTSIDRENPLQQHQNNTDRPFEQSQSVVESPNPQPQLAVERPFQQPRHIHAQSVKRTPKPTSKLVRANKEPDGVEKSQLALPQASRDATSTGGKLEPTAHVAPSGTTVNIHHHIYNQTGSQVPQGSRNVPPMVPEPTHFFTKQNNTPKDEQKFNMAPRTTKGKHENEVAGLRSPIRMKKENKKGMYKEQLSPFAPQGPSEAWQDTIAGKGHQVEHTRHFSWDHPEIARPSQLLDHQVDDDDDNFRRPMTQPNQQQKRFTDDRKLENDVEYLDAAPRRVKSATRNYSRELHPSRHSELNFHQHDTELLSSEHDSIRPASHHRRREEYSPNDFLTRNSPRGDLNIPPRQSIRSQEEQPSADNFENQDEANKFADNSGDMIMPDKTISDLKLANEQGKPGALFKPSNHLAKDPFMNFRIACSVEQGSFPIRCTSFTPDGAMLACGTNTSTICLYGMSELLKDSYKSHSRADAPMVASKENTHRGSIYCLSWGSKIRASNSESDTRYRLLASGSNDKCVKIWRVPHQVLKSGSQTRDTSTLAVKELRKFRGHRSTIRDVKFFKPSGSSPTVVTVGAGDYAVRIWDVVHSKESEPIHKFAGHAAPVFACEVLSGGGGVHAEHMFVSASEDGTIRLWDTRDNKASRVIAVSTSKSGNQPTAVHALSASPTNPWTLASGHADGKVIVWDVGSGKPVCTSVQHSDDCRSVDYSTDGRYVISGSFDGTVAILDTDAFTQQVIQKYKLPATKFLQAKWHPSGMMFATSAAESPIKLWMKVSI